LQVESSTTLAESIRTLVRDEVSKGWSHDLVAHEMRELGQGWSAAIVYSFVSGQRQSLTMDEGVALLAIFGGNTRIVMKRVEEITQQVADRAEKRATQRRKAV
jgi:hypothetical protein